MFTSPLTSLAGWTWAHSVATDLPDQLRLAFPPSARGAAGVPGAASKPESDQLAIHAFGPGAALRFPASGRWHHSQQSGTDVHWVWGQAADVLVHGALRTHLTLGNPLVALRFLNTTDATADRGAPNGVVRGASVELADTPVTAADLTVVACAPGAPGLDTLAVLRYLATALDAEGVTAGPPTWQDFVAALSGLEQPLRILEPGGSPATGRSILVLGGAGPATLTPAHHGDALAALGLSRADLAAGPTIDVSGGNDVITATNGVAVADGRAPLTPSSSRVMVASIEDWLADQQSGDLARYTRGNLVVPFADGAATYADMFVELKQAVDDGPIGAFYVTGYSLQHEAKLWPEGAGTPPLRSVEEIAAAMGAAGGDPRFLALQMLQLNPGWVRDVQTAGALAALLLATAGAVATAFQTDSNADQATFFLHAQAIAIGLFMGASNLDSLIEGRELNRGSIEALDALPGVEAHLDPIDADIDDNPRADVQGDLLSFAMQAQRRFNVFHQKIQVVRNTNGIHAYCGGIDLNANRTQSPAHASRGPFHDVHARVNGPAAGELATTFIQRWRRAAPSTTLALDQPGALDDLGPLTGSDVVQVARTYYRPAPGSGRGLVDFAPDGESTILETLLTAIGQARRYIYIEDQYLTPPPRLTAALADAAAAVSGPLIIVVPGSPDQPFGLPRRQQFIQDMRAAWGNRVRVGILRKRFSHASTSQTSATGRLWLAETLDEADDIVELAPSDRVPSTPFWLTVGGEAMRAHQKVTGFSSPTTSRLHVERADESRLFGGDTGTPRKTHRPGASVLAGSFPSIYVHSKMMLIDDAFASIGSANANRRGFYSDGECNIFGLRNQVTEGDNWIRDLRLDLWAEHLGVIPDYARTALLDPAVGLALFDRPFNVGNRFTTFDAQPYATDLSLAGEFVESTSTLGGVELVAKFIGGLGAIMAGAESGPIFDTVVDPSSGLET